VRATTDDDDERVDLTVSLKRDEERPNEVYERLSRARTRSSPSRWRFRPLSPLTVRFRVEPSG